MIPWKNKQLPIFYVFLYRLFKEKSKSPLVISYPVIREIFNRTILNVPRIYYFHILNEMEELGMIKKIGNKKNFQYEMLEKDLDKILIKYNTIF